MPSKFLTIVSENCPDTVNHHRLLKNLHNLLNELGFQCKDEENGLYITIAGEADHSEEEETTDQVSKAVGILTTADKAFPDNGPTTNLMSPQARRIKSAKKSAMDSLVGAVEQAANTIKKTTMTGKTF